MNFLNRLRLWQKLAALVLVLSVPTMLLGSFYFARVNGEVHAAQDALDGMKYTQALGAMLGEASAHSSKYRENTLTPSEATRTALAASDQLIGKIVEDIEAIDVETAARFNVSGQWQALRSQWINLRTNASRMPLLDAIGRHDELINGIMKQLERVALRSGLLRDPEISTYISVRVALEDVPRALLAYREVRRYAVYSTQKSFTTEAYATNMKLHTALVERYLDRAREGMADTSDATTAAVQPEVEKAEAAFSRTTAFLKEKYPVGAAVQASIPDLYAAMRDTTARLNEVSSVAYDASRDAIEARLARSNVLRTEILVVLVAALVLAVFTAWQITRSLSQPLAQAVSVFHSIAAGMYDTKIDVTSDDEVGQVLGGLRELQLKLRGQSGGSAVEAAAQDRIKSALDKASSRVLLADESSRIIYANDATQRFLFEARADVRRDLPQLDGDHIVGQNLEALFATRPGQRRAVEQALHHVTDLYVGARSLTVLTNAVVDGDGKRVGTLIELIDAPGEGRRPALVGNA